MQWHKPLKQLLPPFWLIYSALFILPFWGYLNNLYFERYDPPLVTLQSLPTQTLQAALVFSGYRYDQNGARILTPYLTKGGRSGAPSRRVSLKTVSGEILCTRPLMERAQLVLLEQLESDTSVVVEVSPLPNQLRFITAPACTWPKTATRYAVWRMLDPVTGKTLLGPSQLTRPVPNGTDGIFISLATLGALFILLSFRKLYARPSRLAPPTPKKEIAHYGK